MLFHKATRQMTRLRSKNYKKKQLLKSTESTSKSSLSRISRRSSASLSNWTVHKASRKSKSVRWWIQWTSRWKQNTIWGTRFREKTFATSLSFTKIGPNRWTRLNWGTNNRVKWYARLVLMTFATTIKTRTSTKTASFLHQQVRLWQSPLLPSTQGWKNWEKQS